MPGALSDGPSPLTPLNAAPTFATLGLSEPLLRAVADDGYEAPTEVQAQAIPAVLAGRDLWASAATGSGKTAAFLLPVLEGLGDRPGPLGALVIAPTRELAAQIGEAAVRYGRHLARRPKVCVAVGGLSINPQLMALRGGADVLVATPGRLLDLVDHNAVKLSALNVLVLDEADRLLSLGFADEIGRIISLLPRCQRLLFSATFPHGVRALAAELLHEPLRVEVAPGVALAEAQSTIVQRAIEVDAPRRTMLLRKLLETEGWPSVLVFVASGYSADHVAQKLRGWDIGALSLHGELSQGARTEALSAFRARRVQVLVATDVAARGLDIDDLPAVVNYDLPRSPTDYLHRVGRTGRAGNSGVALSFVSAATAAHFGLIERRHHLRVPREQIPGFEPVDFEVPAGDPFGGVKGRRKSKKDKLREAAARKS